MVVECWVHYQNKMSKEARHKKCPKEKGPTRLHDIDVLWIHSRWRRICRMCKKEKKPQRFNLITRWPCILTLHLPSRKDLFQTRVIKHSKAHEKKNMQSDRKEEKKMWRQLNEVFDRFFLLSLEFICFLVERSSVHRIRSCDKTKYLLISCSQFKVN